MFGGAVVNLTHPLRHQSVQRLGVRVLPRRFAERAELLRRDQGAVQLAPVRRHVRRADSLRNKAFFFGDYQGLRQDQGRTFLFTVPTAEMRTRQSQRDRQRRSTIRSRGEPFAGNIIPAGRINPIARQVADDLAAAQPAGSRQQLRREQRGQTQRSERVRHPRRRQLRARGARSSPASRARTGTSSSRRPATIFMEGGNASESGNYNAVARPHLHDFSSSMLNELRVGINKYDLAQVGSDFGIPKNNELGIPNGNIDGHPYTSGIADFNISGLSRAPARRASPTRSASATTVQLSDTLSRGSSSRHSLKFGGDVPAHHVDADQSADAAARPLHVRLATTRATSARPDTGDAFASFLLGFPNRCDRDFVDTYPEVLIQLRRLLRAGRFPRHPKPDGESRAAVGPADEPGGEERTGRPTSACRTG